MRRAMLGVLGSVVGCGMGVVSAGPLTPPPGLPASTDTALRNTDPRTPIGPGTTPGDNDATPSTYKITQPGSYYLAGNLTGQSGRIGIEIAASGVTLDLNGFELAGAAGSLQGVRTTVGALSGVRIFGGTVRNWGLQGIELGNATHCRIRDLHALNNSMAGVTVGSSAIIVACTASGNSAAGFVLGGNSTIDLCTSTGNLNEGINASSNSIISRSTVTSNSFIGIQAGAGSVVVDCTATANSSTGILGNINTRVHGCSTTSNGTNGIQVGTGGSVANCIARLSGISGVVATGDGFIFGNQSNNNGTNGDGAGIQIAGSDCVVTDNSTCDNDVGVRAVGAGNFIARNYASGNTSNWSIASGNFGLFVQGVTGVAFTGNAGGASPGSTDPNANYSY